MKSKTAIERIKQLLANSFLYILLFGCVMGFSQQSVIMPNSEGVITKHGKRVSDGWQSVSDSAVSTVTTNVVKQETLKVESPSGATSPAKKYTELNATAASSIIKPTIIDSSILQKGTPPSVAAAPVNDACGSAIALSNGVGTAGTNVSATWDNSGMNTYCQYNNGWVGSNVWYSFTATSSGPLTITIAGGTIGWPLAVLYSGTCGALTMQGSCGSGTSTTYTATPCVSSGTTYYIMVYNDTKWGNTGTFTITATNTTTAANDNCSNATALSFSSGSATATGNNSCTTADNINPSCFTNTTNLWYTFNSSSYGTAVVSVAAGSMVYPSIAVFSGTCGSFTTKSCDALTSTTANSATVTCLSPNTTYYIDIDNFPGYSQGTFTLTVTLSGTALTNDLCANAIDLSSNFTSTTNAAYVVTYSAATTGDNTCASSDQSSTACFTNNHNVWYAFTPTVSGSYYAGVTTGTMSYPEVAVLSGTCGSFTSLGCSGSTSGSAQPYGYWSSTYSYAGGCNLTAGTTYYIMVDNYASYYGTYTLTIANLSNDIISQAAIFPSCGTTFTGSTIGATNCNNCAGSSATNYNNLDCNSSTTASGNSNGADVYAGMSVENDSWYQFCTTTSTTYTITFSPVTSTCIGPSTALQMNLFTGSPSALTWLSGSATNTTLTSTVTLAANACAYIEVDGDAGTNCNYNLTLSNGSGCPLPISLLSFKGDIMETQKIKLSWVVAAEEDLNYYLIEKSNDGVNYNYLSHVKAIGNTTQQSAYYAIDEHPFNGNNYYRLRSVDENGSQNIAAYTVVTNKSHLPSFAVFPNPATDKINVSLANFSSTVYVDFYDMYGKEIFSSSASCDKGNSSMEIDISLFPEGVYFVKAFDGEKFFTKSVIVRKDK